MYVISDHVIINTSQTLIQVQTSNNNAFIVYYSIYFTALENGRFDTQLCFMFNVNDICSFRMNLVGFILTDVFKCSKHVTILIVLGTGRTLVLKVPKLYLRTM